MLTSIDKTKRRSELTASQDIKLGKHMLINT